MQKTEIEQEKPYWVAFNLFPGIGPERFKVLREYFGSAKEVWEASGEELAPILGVALWEKFRQFRREHDPVKYYKLLKSLKLLTTAGYAKREIQVLLLPEKEYPLLLREIEDPPPVLYVLGDISVLSKPQIAVVGTRKMTDYGARVTVELVRGLVAEGLVVTSGLAYGIDTIAHKTALRERGETVAVLGNGVDLCYPQEHLGVYRKIIEGNGAVVSEIPPGTTTHRGIFVARNRIISGLCLGVLVVEGAAKSGTLITAGYGAAQGREVFAVPGPITSQYSYGPNMLIKNGAKAVMRVEDVLEEIGVESNSIFLKGKNVKRSSDYKDIGDEERRIVEIFEDAGESLYIDKIIRISRFDTARVSSILSILEIKGIVKNYGGGRYGLI